MIKTNIIFCLLTYKNFLDLEEFFENLKNKDLNFKYETIVIDNFFNKETTEKIKKITKKNNGSFISVSNKGYGFGNNTGIEFAKKNYKFDYLVVCNPDTVLLKFDFNSLKGYEKNIIAPEILTLNNKKQNPLNFIYMPISEKLMYIGFKRECKAFLYSGIILIKLNRIINNSLMKLNKKRIRKVYSAHGSFIIFSEYALNLLFPIFDDRIFLFCEEGDLAQKAKKNDISIIFNKNIIVRHKEDGSMNMSSENLNNIHKHSYKYYYEKWANNN